MLSKAILAVGSGIHTFYNTDKNLTLFVCSLVQSRDWERVRSMNECMHTMAHMG